MTNTRDCHFFQFLIVLLMCYCHLARSLTLPAPMTQASRHRPVHVGSASCVNSVLPIPKFQPQTRIHHASPWNHRVFEMSLPAPETTDAATFSGYRCSHCGRQQQAGTPHRTGQKPPGRRGRWVGSSAEKQLKCPDVSGAPVLLHPEGTYSSKLVPCLRSQPPHSYPVGNSLNSHSVSGGKSSNT